MRRVSKRTLRQLAGPFYFGGPQALRVGDIIAPGIRRQATAKYSRWNCDRDVATSDLNSYSALPRDERATLLSNARCYRGWSAWIHIATVVVVGAVIATQAPKLANPQYYAAVRLLALATGKAGAEP